MNHPSSSRHPWMPLWLMLLFIGSQTVWGVVVSLIHTLQQGASNSSLPLSPTLLSLSVIGSGLTTVLLAWRPLRVFSFREVFSLPHGEMRRNFLPLAIGFLAAMIGIMATNFICEVAEIENTMEEVFKDMAHAPLGMVSIALVAPLVEELVFRAGIEGYMLRHGGKAWIAIGVSSLAFGLIHLNPVQVVFATLVGLLLGLLYWRTRHIWLCALVHITNNALALIEIQRAEENHYTEQMASMVNPWLVIVGCTLCCIVLMRTFIRMYQSNKI